MDLCQVEGLHDLVNAESFEQMRLAGRWASVGASFISQGSEALESAEILRWKGY